MPDRKTVTFQKCPYLHKNAFKIISGFNYYIGCEVVQLVVPILNCIYHIYEFEKPAAACFVLYFGRVLQNLR